MNRILFLVPNFYKNKYSGGLFKRKWPPLDFAVAAGILEKAGCYVDLIDNNVSAFSPLKIGAISENFDCVVTCTAAYDRWQCPQGDLTPLLSDISEINSDKIIICGPHSTEMPFTILKLTGAAAVIQGEPEIILAELSEKKDLKSLSGAVYLKNSKPFKNKNIPKPIHPEDLPKPSFDLLEMEAYSYELMGKNFTLLEGSRGCPNRCSFCYLGMFGSKIKFKSPKKLFSETYDAVKKYGIKNIYFMDLEFGMKKFFVIEFCKLLIENKLKVNWCCQMRVTDADYDMFKLMKKSGCSLIHFGAESGSDRILQESGKNIKTEDAVRASRLAKSAGIRRAFFFTFGFPGETVLEMESTIRHAIKLNPEYASFHILNPYPGTPMAENKGIKPVLKPFYSYPGYLNSDHDYKTLSKIVKKAYLNFYLRPSYIFRTLRKEAANLKGKFTLFSSLVSKAKFKKKHK